MITTDRASAIEAIKVSQQRAVAEKGMHKTVWSIHKFMGNYKNMEDAEKKGAKPFEVMKFKGNSLLDQGINAAWNDITKVAVQTAWDSTNANLGVGDSSVATTAGMTALQGANSAYEGMDAGYPTAGASEKATWRGTWGSGTGNFVWKEITLSNTTGGGGKNLNRKVQAMGTKAGGTTWIATLEITLS